MRADKSASLHLLKVQSVALIWRCVISSNRVGGPRKLAARILVGTFADLAAGVDRPKGREALAFAVSEELDQWCHAVDRQPSDVRRMMGRILARAKKAPAGPE